jgi:hypothetical protein
MAAAVLLLGSSAIAPARAAADDEASQPDFPTTEFAEGAKSASVTAGPITAGVSMERRKDIDPDFDVPVLTVIVDGKTVLTAPGIASGFDFPAAEASIAEIDPDNKHQEVYFTSYSGGAHCCSAVTVAEELGNRWVAVPVGYPGADGSLSDFDGDGNFLEDLDGDGVAEIVTVDNRFLYTFDCYACSAAPLTIYTVRGGKQIDITGETRFVSAHRDWLKQIEDGVDPAEKWRSPGFLAGWVAEKARLGEGKEAFQALLAHWDLKSDEGEEVCLTNADIDTCPKKQRVVMKFPDRLKRFLDETGYRF